MDTMKPESRRIPSYAKEPRVDSRPMETPIQTQPHKAGFRDVESTRTHSPPFAGAKLPLERVGVGGQQPGLDIPGGAGEGIAFTTEGPLGGLTPGIPTETEASQSHKIAWASTTSSETPTKGIDITSSTLDRTHYGSIRARTWSIECRRDRLRTSNRATHIPPHADPCELKTGIGCMQPCCPKVSGMMRGTWPRDHPNTGRMLRMVINDGCTTQ